MCGATPPPVTEGALAPDPARVEPLREIPGLRKRERTWKDEVRERVRERRKFRGTPGELPLFRGIDDEDENDAAGSLPAAPDPEGPAEPRMRALDDDDLPLRPRDEAHPAITFDTPRPSTEARDAGRRAIAEEPTPASWDLGPSPRVEAAHPVERPAVAFERLYAAALDLAILAPFWAAVVYFASRS
ncbi:MAG: hypothetical protein ACHQ1G_11090, partial [Planctomycetota bacterium]